MNSNTEAPAQFLCKTCGAQSPAGIGYALTAKAYVFPAPAASCNGLHA